MRIALGGITHEANSFCPRETTLADFEARQLARGDEILAAWESTHTEQAGAMSVLDQAPGCQVVPTLLARALSGAPPRNETFRALLDELLARMSDAGPLDGVLLVLHGAMIVEGAPDATGEILARVRALVGPDVPVVGTLDLHANVTARMVDQATALVGYHTAPHVDMFETGRRAAQLLLGWNRGEIEPVTALVRLPMLLPPENSTHAWGPLAEVLDIALAAEQEERVLHVGVYPVQPWLDTADVACAVVAIADGDRAAASAHAQAIATAFWARRMAFAPTLVAPDEAVQRALARESGTVVLCDSADATTSGSTGDSTAVLRAVLDAARAKPSSGHVALLNIVDPPAVTAAIEAGVGATVTLDVGGKMAPRCFQPARVSGRVKTLSDGTFTFRGPGMRGVAHHMGRTAVLYAGDIHLVVMERAVSQWDPQLYRSVGEEPSGACMVLVKSPMAFRAAYEGLYDEVIVVQAPGAADPDLASLPWQHLPRPIYPLDPGLTYGPIADDGSVLSSDARRRDRRSPRRRRKPRG
jgi:microcystin degradation protein MlrC